MPNSTFREAEALGPRHAVLFAHLDVIEVQPMDVYQLLYHRRIVRRVPIPNASGIARDGDAALKFADVAAVLHEIQIKRLQLSLIDEPSEQQVAKFTTRPHLLSL